MELLSRLLANPLVVAGLKIAFVLGFVLQVVPVMVWLERKVCAYIQDRIGPNRATALKAIRLGGMVHSLTDAIKLVFKEDVRPAKAHRFFYWLAPFLVVTPAFLTVAVIPWADDLHVPHGEWLPPGPLPLQIARLDVGVLYVFAIAGLSVFGIMLAGWSSNNKYSLLGGLRSASQLVSYEIALTLSAVSVMVLYGTVRLEEFVLLQEGSPLHWGVVRQPLAFLVFLVAVFAESNRLPFDLPEGESELVAGYHTEYSGFKFGIFMMSEYVHMVVASAVVAAIFLGGWQVPFLPTSTLRQHPETVVRAIVAAHALPLAILSVVLFRRHLAGPRRFGDLRDQEPAIFAVVTAGLSLAGVAFLLLGLPGALSPLAGQAAVALLQFMTFVAKMGIFLFLFIWVRWTLPRFRFDQVMALGWKRLMPLALANIVVTAAYVLWREGTA